MADIHLQPTQVHDNNNGVDPHETKESGDNTGVPDEMWTPGLTPGHHRELPVDVPDTLLQQAYANKVNHDKSSNLTKNETPTRTTKTRSASNHQTEPTSRHNRVEKPVTKSIKTPIDTDKSIDTNKSIDTKLINTDAPRIIEITLRNNDKNERSTKEERITIEDNKTIIDIIDKSEVRESSVDGDYDYPFAKEDYPTMLKTCSDASASPRSSSGRSDSTAAMDTSLILPGKESPLYDARRIDLGSPCRPLGLFLTNRESALSTSFDNPAYGLDLDLHQGLLMRSEEMSDLTIFKRSSKKSKSGKKSSKRDEDKLISASTDDLLSTDVTDFSAKVVPTETRKKKKQSSSGYSTLRSDTDSSDKSFLVVGSKRSFREVAVDCPADFVPVTKGHPIYPPPRTADIAKKSLSTDSLLSNVKPDGNSEDHQSRFTGGKDTKVRYLVRKLMGKNYLYNLRKKTLLSSNYYLINSTYSLSNALTCNKTLNCTVLSPQSSIPYIFDFNDTNEQDMRFKRIESIRNEVADNSRNYVREFVSEKMSDDYEVVSDYEGNDELENAENSALSRAYRESMNGRYFGSLPDLEAIEHVDNNLGATWRRHSITTTHSKLSFDEQTRSYGDQVTV